LGPELELAVLSKSCLDQRIPDEATLKSELPINIAERNGRATASIVSSG
jgi:hypothetical protein